MDDHQVDKVVQLYETMLTRHTTMVVGNTGGGKSVVINTLAEAQTMLNLPTKLYTLNAKVHHFSHPSSVCGCVGVWVCGCVGVWVCGCVGVWVWVFEVCH